MAAVLVYETDFGRLVAGLGKFKNIKLPPGQTMITIEIDGVAKLQGQNAVLAQQVRDKCEQPVKSEAARLAKLLAKWDDTADAKKRDAEVAKELAKSIADLDDELKKLCMSVFKSFAKDKSDYKTYKIKTGIKITVSGGMLVSSIALTAAAGWSGAGTVVGIVGIVRSGASLAQQIAKAAQDADAVFKRVAVNVDKMKRQLNSPSMKANTLKQMGATVLNKVFAVEIETLVVTVSAVEDDFKLLQSKLKGNRINAVSLAKGLPKLLDEQKRLNKDIDTLRQLGVLNKADTGKVKKLEAQLDLVESQTKKVIDQVTKLMKVIDQVETWLPKYSQDIAAISGKYSKTAVKVASVAADLVIAAGSFAGANFADPAKTIKDLYDTSTQTVTALGLTNDAIGTLKDMGVTIYEAAKG